MKSLFFMFCISVLVSCGRNGKDGTNGIDGSTFAGIEGISTGIDFVDIEPGLACTSGGISVFTFIDSNLDGLYQSSSESILKVKALCNGVDGAAGQDGASGTSITLESISSSGTCPNGGVKLLSGSGNPVEVCNGINGLNGENGLPGVQGIPGINGSNGTNGTNGTVVTPVKFCPSDNSSFPEYGLLVGDELFAVFWGTTPASPSVKQAFLTKLVAGNYMSTGGNNCLFSVQ